MMHDQYLLTYPWEKATSTIVYIQNKSPHAILENKTQEEAFTDEKLEVEHLRIFGCLVYIHVLKKRRMKLELSGKKGTFVDYSETSKDYRIYEVFHGDASPRVGYASRSFPTSPGRGNSWGNVSPRPPFGGNAGKRRGKRFPKCGTRPQKRGASERPPLDWGGCPNAPLC